MCLHIVRHCGEYFHVEWQLNSVVALSVTMRNVFMLSVIILSVVMLSVVLPFFDAGDWCYINCCLKQFYCNPESVKQKHQPV